jgi:hypothetical protein
MHDPGNAARKHGIPRRVIAMVRAHDVPFHGTIGDRPDLIEHRLCRSSASLAVGNEHTISTDDDEAHGREPRRANLLVAKDAVGELDDAREIAQLKAALDRVRGPRLRLERSERDTGDSAHDGEVQSFHVFGSRFSVVTVVEKGARAWPFSMINGV